VEHNIRVKESNKTKKEKRKKKEQDTTEREAGIKRKCPQTYLPSQNKITVTSLRFFGPAMQAHLT